ncbi:serine O-acetyltransferase EpsC [Halotalea alkalilenta]|nr:serine O-acetyltransferase EpsC [Halotalea alkalilenta]
MPREYRCDTLWAQMLEAAHAAIQRHPLLAGYYRASLLEHDGFASALAGVIARTLASEHVPFEAARDQVREALAAEPRIVDAALDDILVLLREDAAIPEPFTPLLYFPGYRALQCQRVAHAWWQFGLTDLASYLQYRVACDFAVDIHPAARIGSGIFIDHGAGIVIGETAVVEDGVTLFQGVTLGGTGKLDGDRHPKVRRGAFLGAGALVLGNIEIGEGAKVGAGAIVTKPVAPGDTVVGPTARVR